MTEERRHFSRVNFQADVFIWFEDNRYQAELMDISLKGALIRFGNKVPIQKGDMCILEFELSQSDIVLKAETILVYSKQDNLGLKFNSIDLESMIHLRRLVELNVGDPDQIQKELFFLVNVKY